LLPIILAIFFILALFIFYEKLIIFWGQTALLAHCSAETGNILVKFAGFLLPFEGTQNFLGKSENKARSKYNRILRTLL
jgi:hypothetical protein